MAGVPVPGRTATPAQQTADAPTARSALKRQVADMSVEKNVATAYEIKGRIALHALLT
jgi:hypothetical protein